jgi:hypothetical protein
MVKGIFPDNTVKDYGDDYLSISVFEKSDLVVTSTEKIAEKFIDESGETIWVDSEIGKNAAGETVYLKVLSEGSTKPTWVPGAIVAS